MAARMFVASLVCIFILAGTGVVLAGHPDTGPGCGLGKIAWENYDHPQHIGPQVLMATTNGTGFNTLAISSGTSGCTNDGVIVQNEKLNIFVASNYENIVQDMAKGHGEYLTSLATLMEIPTHQQQEFGNVIQANYPTLIKEGNRSPKDLILAIQHTTLQHPMLAQATITR